MLGAAVTEISWGNFQNTTPDLTFNNNVPSFINTGDKSFLTLPVKRHYCGISSFACLVRSSYNTPSHKNVDLFQFEGKFHQYEIWFML